MNKLLASMLTDALNQGCPTKAVIRTMEDNGFEIRIKTEPLKIQFFRNEYGEMVKVSYRPKVMTLCAKTDVISIDEEYPERVDRYDLLSTLLGHKIELNNNYSYKEEICA